MNTGGGRDDAPEVVTPDQAMPPRGGRSIRRSETVVLAAVGVAVVAVGVAAMALGRDDGGSRPAADATTTTETPAADGTDPTGPIVGPSGIVGWWSGSAWVPRAEGEPPEGAVDVRIVRLGAAPTRGRAVTVAEECASQRATGDLDLAVALGDDEDGDRPPAIAVAGVPDPVPRPVEQFEPGAPTYRQAAAEVAAALGATTPPTVVQVLRADLDGSGTKEVVVAASHVADPAAAQGDWSVVFARRVTGDGVATDVLASSTAGSRGELDRIRVSSLADLNADGTMELVLDGRSTGGGRWTAVHALDDDGAPVEVLREGCDG